jgi:hypothetical protein
MKLRFVSRQSLSATADRLEFLGLDHGEQFTVGK